MSDLIFRVAPLGMNLRNQMIRELNPRPALHLARDKSAFKHLMKANSIATPRLYHEIHDFSDMKLIPEFPSEFVVKPSRGYGGSGVVLLERQGEHFVDAVGQVFTGSEVRWHIRKILDGDFSGYLETDIAIIEERIYPSEKLRFKNSVGLPDLRLFCCEFRPIMAMLRYPTFKSKGRSNLTTGAIGMGIDVETGGITFIRSKKTGQEFSPGDLEIPPGFHVPAWTEVREVAVTCSRLTGLRFSGVDIVLNTRDEVMVLEINGRPGLEIQNINEDSLLGRIRSLRTVAEPG